ncbi:MAG: polysaccharide pyruvyl transferase family protein [Flavobacterium sp.]|nr:MAG: polysaccharide pyruvyl transferase family protein [Flavobacterium sp.]
MREFANVGTNMQSYSTFKAIQKQFPNDQVEIIDYSGWKPAMKPYLTQVSLQSLYYDFIRIRKHQKIFKTEYRFSKNKLIASDLKRSIDFINSQEYDAIYVGSDTLLELKRAKNDELTAYWLDSSVKAKKFMIAASSHNVVYEDLSQNRKDRMKEAINDYSLLGVRDEASFRLMSNFIEKDDSRLQFVPDPTFTLEVDYNKIEAYFKKKRVSFNKPIVCLHLLRNTKWANELALAFKKKGYIVASLRPAFYADVIFTDLSPFEQVGLYKYFDLVISLLYQQRFSLHIWRTV